MSRAHLFSAQRREVINQNQIGLHRTFDTPGFLAEETFSNAARILAWLQRTIAHFYPNSSYTRTLDPDVRQLGTQRLFQPPRTAASVRCPHWGAPPISC
jgi:hypothetical protein